MMFGSYETKTTFWEDFTIADKFGEAAVRDTYKRAMEEWKTNADYLTELVMVLNWKLWQHHKAGNTAMAEQYNTLYWEAAEYAETHLTGEDLIHYFAVTD